MTWPEAIVKVAELLALAVVACVAISAFFGR